MPWPLSQDYNEALQSPQISFSDPELRQGQVVVNALGIPQPCSGNFADVYAVECPSTRSKWAVKCFTREVYGLGERYGKISSYLQQIRFPFMVGFEYQEQGVRITGRWYPLVKMQWIEGFALNTFVRNTLEKPAKLEKLSRIWVRMASRLRDAGIAHCDLQHGNVLLVPDREQSSLAVKLIDYDGIWVPALADAPSGEFGHPAYQHPRRLLDNIYNAEVDRFPLLAVYVALRALALGGRKLWKCYDTGDNLLFRQSDFDAPEKSSLFADLLRMNQPDVRALVTKLMDAAHLPLEQTPHLADLVGEEMSAPSALRRRQALGFTEASASQELGRLPDIEREAASRDRGASLLAWMATGALAAFAVIGGMSLWRMQTADTTKNVSAQPAFVQTTTPAPKDEKSPPTKVDKNDSPQPVDVSKESIPPSNKTTEPSKPPPSPVPPKRNDPPAKPMDVPKLPVPEDSVLTSATEEIRDTYRAEYSSKDAAVLANLAEKLIQRGQKKFETPERRFVFFREASDVASKAGDAVLSLRALEELGKVFAVELLPRKAAALHQAAKTARTLSANKIIVDRALALIVATIRADDYDAAEDAIRAAAEAAYKAGVPPTEIQLQAKEIGQFKKNYLAIKPALATLAANPKDAEANRLVGAFLCFQKGDWQKGLPRLARGDNAKLQDLAEQDLAAPTSTDGQTALGNGWWLLGVREKDQAKAHILQRACYWYERALPDAVATVRTRLVRSIETHYKVLPALRNWDHLDISAATAMLGYLHLPKGGKEILTREVYSGPIEITVLARTEKNNIRLGGGRGAGVIFNWERKAEELRVTRPDGQQPGSGSLAAASITPLVPNTWYALRWIITEDGMSVAINGEIVFSERHKNDLSGKYPIRIHSADSDIDVKVFHVRSLGKKSE